MCEQGHFYFFPFCRFIILSYHVPYCLLWTSVPCGTLEGSIQSLASRCCYRLCINSVLGRVTFSPKDAHILIPRSWCCWSADRKTPGEPSVTTRSSGSWQKLVVWPRVGLTTAAGRTDGGAWSGEQRLRRTRTHCLLKPPQGTSPADTLTLAQESFCRNSDIQS